MALLVMDNKNAKKMIPKPPNDLKHTGSNLASRRRVIRKSVDSGSSPSPILK